jgi:general secretion pathway protein J
MPITTTHRDAAGCAACRTAPARGFTLLELLVAISVLAIVSMIAWRGLDTLVSTRARLAPEGEDVRALLAAFGQLERDLAQAANPQLFATTEPPVAVVAVGGSPALTVTRIAPGSADAATALQVVGYRVQDGVLVRSASRPLLARGALAAEDITNVRLLDSVKSLRLRIWREGVGWIDPLTTGNPPSPPSGPGSPASAWPSPPGVEVVVERENGRVFRRVLLVG